MTLAAGSFLASLHGLRGLLSLWIVMVHVGPRDVGPLHVAAYGFVGVDLFFCMSGFVLMQVHAAEFGSLRLAAVRRFLLLRWWRTYPIALVCMVLAAGAYLARYRNLPDLQKFLESAFLLEGWARPGIGINLPVWTLGAEWLGYLAFPLIAWLCRRLPPGAALALALTTVGAEMLVLLTTFDGMLDLISGWPAVLRMAAGFSAGCLLWRSHAALAEAGGQSDLGMLAGVVAMTAVLLFLPPAWALLPLFGIAHGAARPGPWTERLLTLRPMMFLGRISFALYLCHMPLLKLLVVTGLFQTGWQKPLGTVILYAGCILLATALHHGVEEPLRKFGRRLAGPLRPDRTAAAPLGLGAVQETASR